MKENEIETFEDKNLHPIMVSEAWSYLEGQRDRIFSIGADKSEFKAAFQKTFEYVEQYSKIKGKTLISDLIKLLKSYELTDIEVSSVGSLLPQSVEDIRVLIPSLNRLDEDSLLRIISKLQHLS